MNLVIWLAIGLLAGLVTTRVVKRRRGSALDLAAGIAGAVVGGRLVAPLLGLGAVTQDDFSPEAALIALLCAITALAISSLRKREPGP